MLICELSFQPVTSQNLIFNFGEHIAHDAREGVLNGIRLRFIPKGSFVGQVLVAAYQRNRVEWVESKKHLLHEQIKLDGSLFCNTSLNPATVVLSLLILRRTSSLM